MFIYRTKGVVQLRISAFCSASVTAAYISTPPSGLVARPDLRNFSASIHIYVFQQALENFACCNLDSLVAVSMSNLFPVVPSTYHTKRNK